MFCQVMAKLSLILNNFETLHNSGGKEVSKPLKDLVEYFGGLYTQDRNISQG